MKSRGFTLIELMMGVVTAAVIAAASAGLIKAGIMTYTFSVRQNEAMSKLRKAVQNEGSASGMLPAARSAHTVNALSATQFGVLSATSSALTSFYASGGNLMKSVSGSPSTYSESISTITVRYYNLDANGLVIESTSAAGAWLVTSLVTVQAKNNKQKDHMLFTGTLLRNKQ